MKETRMRVSGLLALGLLLSAGPLAAQESAAATLPKAQDIIARFIEMSGGAETIRKHNSLHMTGKLEIPAQSIVGTLEAWNAGGKLVTVIEIAGIGNIRTGFDGTTAWQIHPAFGASVLSGRQRDQMVQQADLQAALTPEKYVKSRETTEKTTFDGKEAYKVKTVLLNGEEYYDYYDASNGLNIGSQRKSETPMGPVETVTTISEYQKFDGLLIPTKMKQGAMGFDQVITITKVELIPVDAKVFELPKEIKALAGKQ